MYLHPVVILTREAEDNISLADRLNSLGIEVVLYPCIQTTLLPFGEASFLPPGVQLADFLVIVFTSKRGVAGMVPVAQYLARSQQIFAVVGQRTAAAVKAAFLREPSFIANPATSESLAHLLLTQLAPASPILHVRGNKSTGLFKTKMTQNGFPVTELEVYRNDSPQQKPLAPLEKGIVLLASPSAARFFFQTNPDPIHRSWTYLAIGPTTANYLKKIHLPHVVESPDPGTDSVVEKIRELVA